MKHLRFLAFFLFLPLFTGGSISTGQDGAGEVGVRRQMLEVCGSFQVEILPASGSFNFCPESVGTESFTAEAGYAEEGVSYNPQNFTYSWLIDGSVYSGMQVSHTFSGSGAYSVRLVVEDPANGCSATVYEVVRVGTLPTFNGTIATVENACATAPFTLVGTAHPTTWTGFPTAVTETSQIPDGTGEVYQSSLSFNVFERGQQITSAMDIDRICVNLEHVDFGHLKIDLECPDGTSITLKDFGFGGANLGEPVVWDDFIPGRGYEYCFSPEPEFGRMDETAYQFHAYTDNAGNYYFNSPFLPAGSYTPDETLTNLTNCSLNGEWTLTIRDNTPGETGHVLGWSLLFNERFYPDSLIFTPEIVSGTWYGPDGPLNGNPANASVDEPGEYPFRFEALDDFGCVYDTTIFVNVLPLPKAEILSELELPVCEGDSTLLTVVPVSGSNFDWIYQWQFGGQDIPGQDRDTITAREVGLYSVMVTDTLTGCFDVFNQDFSYQNCDLVIPNVFTPNGDGINDVFEILNLEHYPMAQIVIYNRWGNKVFEHSDYYNNWWDGQDHSDGVYYYVIRYTRLGETKHAEGAVTIIR
jgi:gliding motility-associated-like protein